MLGLNNLSNVNFGKKDSNKIRNDAISIATATAMLASPFASANNNDSFQYKETKTEYVANANTPKNSKEQGKQFIKWFWDMFYADNGDGNLDYDYMKEQGYKSKFSIKGTTKDLAKSIIENLDGYVYGQKGENNTGEKDGKIDIGEYADLGLDEFKKREGRVFTSSEREALDNFFDDTFQAMDCNESFDTCAKHKNTIDVNELSANLECLKDTNGQIDAKKMLEQWNSAESTHGLPTEKFEVKRKDIYNQNKK